MTTEVSVQSRSHAGIAYRVTLGVDGAAVCSCPGYEFRGACWHLDAARGKDMTSQALEVIRVTPPTSILPTESDMHIMSVLARSVVKARGHAVPQSIDSPEKAFAVMLAGHELGVPPMTALRHLFVVNGRTEPDAQLMAGIVAAREPDSLLEVLELSESTCTMRLTRPRRALKAEYTYTIDDAKRAGLVKQNNPWALYPKDMMRWACQKRLLRAYAPDLINSIGGGVEVDVAGDLMTDRQPAFVDTDVRQLPREALFAEGDDDLSLVIDPETGEVLEEGGGGDGAPAEDEAEPTEVVGMVLDGGALSREVWTYVGELLTDVCVKHFEGDWEKFYAAFGGHPEATPFFQRTRSGRPFIDPRGRTNEEAQALAALVQAWLRSRNNPSAPKSEPPAADEPVAVKVPRAPRARAEKDGRLGGFANVGEFLGWCHRELGLNGLQVREIADLPESAPPTALLEYEGGLDVLKVACAAKAAGVVQAETVEAAAE